MDGNQLLHLNSCCEWIHTFGFYCKKCEDMQDFWFSVSPIWLSATYPELLHLELIK